jgi:hypothetical protein
MKPCPQCQQLNADDARFCHQCGASFVTETQSTAEPLPTATGTFQPDEDLMRAFIGPNADRYLQTFKKFVGPSGPRFALTWHWPAFIFEPFLWFLYRKMYLYALIYAIGPAIAFYMTQDLSADIVWRLMAGASANYIYFWHVKEQLSKIKQERPVDRQERTTLLGELGGVQPYVVWVGVGLLVLKVGLVVTMLKEGPPDGSKAPPAKPRPVGLMTV